jgi:hypothetical protein
MRKIEGIPPQREVQQFADKIDRLIQQGPSESLPEVHSDKAFYETNGLKINVIAPYESVRKSPAEIHQPVQAFSAIIMYPSSQQGDYRYRKSEIFSTREGDLAFTQGMSYETKTIVFDKGNHPKPDQELALFMKGDINAWKKLVSERKKLEEELGTNVVTPDKYEKVMGLLNSLDGTKQDREANGDNN